MSLSRESSVKRRCVMVAVKGNDLAIVVVYDVIDDRFRVVAAFKTSKRVLG